MSYFRSMVVVSLFSVASLAAAACSGGGDGGEGGAGGAGAGGKEQQSSNSAVTSGTSTSQSSSATSSASSSASSSVSSSVSSSAASSTSSSTGSSVSSSASGGAGISFAADVQPIFTANCLFSGCHGATAAKGLILSKGKAYQELVDVKSAECTANGGRQLVEPGLPTLSYLMDKLNGTNICSGVRMPENRPPLSDADLQAIAGWIQAGALDN